MSKKKSPVKVMIAGIGGASLGTEILKSLCLVGDYKIYGCDISSTAYGLYDPSFTKTFHIDSKNYVTDVLALCSEYEIKYLIPGGERPMALLGAESEVLYSSGIQLLANSAEVIARYSDKEATFKHLSSIGISIPNTVTIKSKSDLDQIGLPCIVKPATGSGGSAAVFFAISADEAMVYADFIMRSGSAAVAQEYVDDSEGEFTIGVLSLNNGNIVGSIALRRVLDAKLSVAYRGRGGLISSGYSQGHIDLYPQLCHQAEQIAVAIGSRGPINVQGRVRDGILLPFEINPRFSASTYLRAIAGFNEVHSLIKFYEEGVIPLRPKVKVGWYLRSLTEKYIAPEEIK